MNQRHKSHPTFSSKSLICLLWISVLSSRSRILCDFVFFYLRENRHVSSNTHHKSTKLYKCRGSQTWWAWCSSSILSWRIWQSYSRLFLSICLRSFSTAIRSSSFCSSFRGSSYFITWWKEISLFVFFLTVQSSFLNSMRL